VSRLARFIALAVATAGLAGVGGCSSGETVDFENGRALFTEKCGTCHALAEAGSAEGVGPNLDAAFANARAEGMDSDTIEGVVAAQIENPRTYEPELVNLYMPAGLVEGDDAADVSYYVGQVAGVPGIAPPAVPGFEDEPGAQVFANNGCGSCHTLEGFPGATGTLGPDLTETLAGQSPQEIESSIVDPSATIVQGFDDAMPGDYGDIIPPDDLEALVQFLVEQTGGGSPGSSGP
jgi:mono/diheme cytochrome c family protein